MVASGTAVRRGRRTSGPIGKSLRERARQQRRWDIARIGAVPHDAEDLQHDRTRAGRWKGEHGTAGERSREWAAPHRHVAFDVVRAEHATPARITAPAIRSLVSRP
jgi:hypothetical protein